MSLPPYRSPEQMDASFRVLASYDVGSDSFITRLDVRLPYPALQFHIDLATSKPGHSDLATPTRGVDGCLSVKAASADLSAVFRKLADRIDKQNLEWPELDVGDAGKMLSVNWHQSQLVAAEHQFEKNSVKPNKDKNDHIWRALRAAAGG